MRRSGAGSMAISRDLLMHMGSARCLCISALGISTSRDRVATLTPEMCSALECARGCTYGNNGVGVKRVSVLFWDRA